MAGALSVQFTQETIPAGFVTAPEVLLPPPQQVGYAGALAVRNLAEHGYIAALGLSEGLRDKIAAVAHQEFIRENCWKDEGPKRFGTLESAGQWLGKNGGRAMVTINRVPERQGPISLSQLPGLSVADTVLAAYGWLGREPNKHIPGADVTTAYRVSEEFRKEGLGWVTGVLVVGTAVNRYGLPPERMSLDVWDSNSPAKLLYMKLGFAERARGEPEWRPTLWAIGTEFRNGQVAVARIDEDGKAQHMVQDSRIYMQLDPQRWDTIEKAAAEKLAAAA
ncbi:MAG TPA: hypothetical protein VF261_02395 [Candidatus Saccharimonadales bacterium]